MNRRTRTRQINAKRKLAKLLTRKAALKCVDSLYEFVKQAWRIVDNATYVDNWHIEAVCRHLEAVTRGEIQYLCINIPPGHSKSLLVNVFWPAWEWIKNPGMQYQFASNSGGLSVRDNLKARRLLGSPWFQSMFVERDWTFSVDENGKTYYTNTAGGSRRIASPSSKTTGWRSHRLNCDDLITASEAYSDPKRSKANNWFKREFLNRRNDEENDPVIVIGQRLHDDDVFGVIENELSDLGWVWLVLPTRFEPDNQRSTWSGFKDPRTRKGELLNPKRVGEIQDKRNRKVLGPVDYEAQHGQNPTPPGGIIFPKTKFRILKLTPKEVAAEADAIVLSVDCAFKDTSTSDFVCIQVIARLGSRFVLIAEQMERLSYSFTKVAIRRMYKHWAAYCPAGITAVLVEDKANGSAVIDELSRDIPGLLAINPQGGKESRAHACVPLVDAGNVYFCDIEYDNPKVPGEYLTAIEKIERFSKFPKLANDDDIDAFTQALIWFRSSIGQYWWSWGTKKVEHNTWWDNDEEMWEGWEEEIEAVEDDEIFLEDVAEEAQETEFEDEPLHPLMLLLQGRRINTMGQTVDSG